MVQTITFDNDISAYYPGQIISGVVELNISEPLTFSVITATFLGEAKVEWMAPNTEINEQKQNIIKYSGTEEYFKLTQNLAGHAGQTLRMPVGSQRLRFRKQIPFHIPSSFRGKHGSIEYSVRVQMFEKDHPLFENEIVKAFEVVAPLDLNKAGDVIKRPLEMELEKANKISCFCNYNPVTIKVHLPMSGYCPGQVIPISVDVDNKSHIEVNEIILQLLCRESYRSKQPPSELISPPQVLLHVKRGPIHGGSTRKYNIRLTVPDILVPYLEHCTIIDVQYCIKTTIKLSGFNSDLEEETEIKLGLVPLAETIEDTYEHPLAKCLPQGPIPEGTNYKENPERSQLVPRTQPMDDDSSLENNNESFTHLIIVYRRQLTIVRVRVDKQIQTQ